MVGFFFGARVIFQSRLYAPFNRERELLKTISTQDHITQANNGRHFRVRL